MFYKKRFEILTRKIDLLEMELYSMSKEVDVLKIDIKRLSNNNVNLLGNIQHIVREANDRIKKLESTKKPKAKS